MAEARRRPLIWLLLGAKAGDNAQVKRLGELLLGDKVTHQLAFNNWHHLPNLVLGAGLASLAVEARAALIAPWPDIVIAAGKRSAPVALWIKQQSKGRSRLVHIGRPRARLADFDLVVTTPQYGLPPDGNVLELPLPLVGPVMPDAQALAHWRMAWQDLPRPLVAVAIGAAKYPLRFGEQEQERLASLLNSELAAGGSALLLASPRTDPGVVTRIASRLTVDYMSYARFDKANNPYSAALTLCDRAVVTGDSASMLADALSARRPVSVFSLPVAEGRLTWSGRRGVGALLARYGVLQPPRAMHHLVANLLSQGLAGELGGAAGTGLNKDHESAAVQRVKDLISGQ
jgi:hypothetical protein